MKSYYKNEKGILYHGDALDITKEVEKNSVHCVVTSPPYWGKVIYDDINGLGLEKTPQLYLNSIVNIFKEVRKVLHPSGTVWLNIGDTRCVPSTRREGELGMKPGVKAKNLIGIPWKVALALQEDGWWIRSSIIWYRTNSPREPMNDRPTDEHEYLFLLTKKANYFYDKVPLLQKLKAGDHFAGDRDKIVIESGGMFKGGHNRKGKLEGRNIGSVWEIPTEARTDPHYAAFPSELVKRCIKGGTSEKGCCSKCGAPIKRIYEREDESDIPKTLGWEPTCKCSATTKPCVVLDPFMGRGTTALVAEDLSRNWIGIEKGEESCELVRNNMQSRKYGLIPVVEPQKGLFNLTKEGIMTR